MPGSPGGHTGCRKQLSQDTESGSESLTDVKGFREELLRDPVGIGLWLCSCGAFSMGGAAWGDSLRRSGAAQKRLYYKTNLIPLKLRVRGVPAAVCEKPAVPRNKLLQ